MPVQVIVSMEPVITVAWHLHLVYCNRLVNNMSTLNKIITFEVNSP